jgi:hypothetical protein
MNDDNEHGVLESVSSTSYVTRRTRSFPLLCNHSIIKPTITAICIIQYDLQSSLTDSSIGA